MGRRYVIIGPTSLARVSFGVQPVGITNAVISPQAMNAPMLGITIAARLPPNRWTRSCTVPPPLRNGLGGEDGRALKAGQLPMRRAEVVTILTTLVAVVSSVAAGHQRRRRPVHRPRRA